MSKLISSRRVLFSALVATTVGACATSEEPEGVADEAAAPDPALVDAYRHPEAAGTAPALDPAFAARMQAQVDRAQAYLDEHVVPDFDRALRETSGVSYETIKGEIAAAMALPDPGARRAAIEQAVAARKPNVDAALARLGVTSEQLGDRIAQAARAGDVPLPAPESLPNKRGACGTGFQFEPVPPYFQAGTFATGTNTSGGGLTSNVNGTFLAQASSIGGYGTGVSWVRADNIPPFGAGVTTVSTVANFGRLMTELLLYFPAWAMTGVGITIETRDGGPSGPVVGTCRLPLLESSLPIGYSASNFPRVVFHACAFHHAAGTGFLSTKVLVDTWASSAALIWGGFSQAIAEGAILQVNHNTCLD